VELAARKEMEGFGLWGVVKEDTDGDGLEGFRGFFPRDLYLDEERGFYDALGGRKMGLPTWNPLSLWRGTREVMGRLKQKGIQGNLKGEGLVQGGVILFGKDGSAKYAYEEITGKEIPTGDILKAAEAMK